jgi:hypothetical protein
LSVKKRYEHSVISRRPVTPTSNDQVEVRAWFP